MFLQILFLDRIAIKNTDMSKKICFLARCSGWVRGFCGFFVLICFRKLNLKIRIKLEYKKSNDGKAILFINNNVLNERNLNFLMTIWLCGLKITLHKIALQRNY